MSKKIFSLLLAVMLVVSMFAIATVSVSAGTDADGRYVPSTDETRRYYFLMPDDWFNEKTSDAGIYWWEGTDACPTWQDMYKAQKDSADKVFYVDCPKDVTTIIWTNMLDAGTPDAPGAGELAKQSANIPSEYYDPGESDLYPDGIPEEVGFDKMIWVCTEIVEVENEYTGLVQKVYNGDWFYYYGNGKYGTDPNGSGDVEPTTPAVAEGKVNGETVHAGDTVSYTVSISASEALENVQAVVNYDGTALKLVETSDDKALTKTVFPVLGNVGGTVWNTNLENMVKFNASSLDGYDFTAENVLVTLTFEVLEAKDTTIATVIEEMNGSNGTCFVSDSAKQTEFAFAEKVAVTACPHATEPQPTDPSKPATEETTVPATTTGDVATDEEPTTTPNAQGGTSDPNGTVQTGDVSFAVVLLAVLVAASGAMFVVRKRVNG